MTILNVMLAKVFGPELWPGDNLAIAITIVCISVLLVSLTSMLLSNQ